MIKKGDSVILKEPFWHHGSNIGGRLGTVVDNFGHILVEVCEYPGNPVKCFRDEILLLCREEQEMLPDETDDPWELP